MRELEKTLMEIESAIKDHERRGNTHTQSVLQIAHEIIAVCAKYARTLPDLEVILGSGGWIPVEKELPPNAKHKGALCPRYQLKTKYGVTEGWYNPDLESWFVLVWFMTERCLESEIDFDRGAHPKIVRCENKVNDRNSVVTAWRPRPEPYRPEPTTQRPEWKDRMLHTFLGGHHD